MIRRLRKRKMLWYSGLLLLTVILVAVLLQVFAARRPNSTSYTSCGETYLALWPGEDSVHDLVRSSQAVVYGKASVVDNTPTLVINHVYAGDSSLNGRAIILCPQEAASLALVSPTQALVFLCGKSGEHWIPCTGNLGVIVSSGTDGGQFYDLSQIVSNGPILGYSDLESSLKP